MNAPEPQTSALTSRVKSLAPALVIFFMIMAMTLGLRYVSVGLITDDIRKATLAECERIAELLEAQLNLRMRSLDSIANHLAHSDDTSPITFSGYTREVMRSMSGFMAIAVTDSELDPLMIETSRDLSLAHFRELLKANQLSTALGAAADKALANRELVITNPVNFGDHGSGFVAVRPYFRGDDLEGFVLGAFVYQSLVEQVLPESSSEFNISLLQWDIQMNVPAYQVTEFAAVENSPLIEPAEVPRFIGHQRWAVRVEPSGSENTLRGAIPSYFTSGTILTLGTILAIILSIILYRQQLVADRSRTEARASRTKLDSTSQHLARMKEELDLILNHVDEAIILYDENLAPVQANSAFKRHFCSGRGRDGLLRVSADTHHKMMAGLFRNETQYWGLLNHLHENPERPFNDEIDSSATSSQFQRRSTTVLNPDGSRRGYLVIYRDITSERTVERLKEDFLSSVTHDLRTPLASIKGFAETMLRDDAMKQETRKEFTNIICNESSRLQEMIEDLLDLRRMEEGRTDLSPAPVNLRSLVEEVVNSSQPILFYPRDISVDLQWRGRADREIYGDPGMIGRAIRNVLSNATKYSPRHSTIHIRGIEKADRVELAFIDEGPGIPPEDLPHLFEKFYRGYRHVRRTQGTGLGLAIVKHIMESHGGIATASNAPGKGACIKLVLPRELEDRLTHLDAAAPSEASPPAVASAFEGEAALAAAGSASASSAEAGSEAVDGADNATNGRSAGGGATDGSAANGGGGAKSEAPAEEEATSETEIAVRPEV